MVSKVPQKPLWPRVSQPGSLNSHLFTNTREYWFIPSRWTEQNLRFLDWPSVVLIATSPQRSEGEKKQHFDGKGKQESDGAGKQESAEESDEQRDIRNELCEDLRDSLRSEKIKCHRDTLLQRIFSWLVPQEVLEIHKYARSSNPIVSPYK
jgi:hypothetical protein